MQGTSFEYKPGSASRCCNASRYSISLKMAHCFCMHRPDVGLSNKDLQLQLLQALLQSQPDTANSSSNTSEPHMSVPTSVTTPKLGPMQGLLLGEAPAAALNRSQLMQALFRLELNTQTPQVCHALYANTQIYSVCSSPGFGQIACLACGSMMIMSSVLIMGDCVMPE